MEFYFDGAALWAVSIVFAAISISFIFAFARLIKGPTLADRVVALDLVAYQVIAFIVIYAIASGQHAFIESGLVLALVAFLGTLAFARYIERNIALESHSTEGEEETA